MNIGDKYRTTDTVAHIVVKVVGIHEKQVAVVIDNLPNPPEIKIDKTNFGDKFVRVKKESDDTYSSHKKELTV